MKREELVFLFQVIKVTAKHFDNFFRLINMCKYISIIVALLCIGIAYLPSPIEPENWTYDLRPPPTFEGVLQANNELTGASKIFENAIYAPESLLFNHDEVI